MEHHDVPEGKRWYAVHTKPKQEVRADFNLRSWGVETLAPQLRELQPTRRPPGIRQRTVALFPGYIFARFDARALLAKIRLTRGVHSVVGHERGALPVEEQLIDIIRRRIDADGFVRVAAPQPGDAVEIIAGPLRSFVGIFERAVPGRDRVAVLLSAVSCGARVELPRSFIRKSTCSAA